MFLSVQEFMTFTSQLIVERSAKGSRASVKEQGKSAPHPCPVGAGLATMPQAAHCLVKEWLAWSLSHPPPLPVCTKFWAHHWCPAEASQKTTSGHLTQEPLCPVLPRF